MRVPSFCAKNVTGRRSCAASALSIAVATSLATPTSAAFRIVAFSRSSRPTEPISWLSDTWTSPSSRLTISAASSSWRADTGANTLVIATPSALPATPARNCCSASPSNGARSRPSNSMPPPMIAAPTDTAPARSAGHSYIGRTACVAGPPMRTTATRRSLRRSSTALVACVVPSITWVTRPGSMPGARSTLSMAAVIPPVISGVHGTFALASSRSSASRMTASVFVPPTSIPRRKSSAGTGQFLHGHVVELVADRARPGDGKACRAAPHRVAPHGDDRDPLPVPHPLGGDRIGGLRVQHGDQVGNGGEHPALLERDQVLVLQLKAAQPACVIAEALHDHGAPHDSAGRAALDIGDLPADQPPRSGLADQRLDRVADGLGQRLADPDRQRHRAAHGGPPGLGDGHRVLGRGGRAAELDRRGPGEALHPVPGDRAEDDHVAALVGHHARVRVDPR